MSASQASAHSTFETEPEIHVYFVNVLFIPALPLDCHQQQHMIFNVLSLITHCLLARAKDPIAEEGMDDPNAGLNMENLWTSHNAFNSERALNFDAMVR